MTDRFHFPRAAFPAGQAADAASLVTLRPMLDDLERRTRPAPQVTIEDALRMMRRLSGWTMGRMIDDPDGWDRLRDEVRAMLDRAAS